MKKKTIICSSIILVAGIICAVVIYVNRSSSAQVEEPQLPMFYDGTNIDTDAVPSSTSDLLETWTEVPLDTSEEIIIVNETDLKEQPYNSSPALGTAKVGETFEVTSCLVENEYVRTSKGYISMLDADWVSALNDDEEMS